MKLHRLELEGFGPFRAPQAVDFDAFDDDGIFLISGRTGSGKSSILDGVCFALFGSVPRYEGSEKRIRSDHSTPDDVTRVRLEFTAAGRRWAVTRAPEHERPRARGEGLTTVPHAAQLEERVGTEWVARAARPREVAHLLDEIVGLSQQQFLQVILLAQGRFAQFLLAKNDERQALLRSLFGSRVYQEYQGAFEERRKASGRAFERSDDAVRVLLVESQLLIAELGVGRGGGDGVVGEATSGADVASTPTHSTLESSSLPLAAQIAGVARAVERAAYRADTLDRTADVAENAHAGAASALERLSAVRAGQIDRVRSRAALAALDAAEPTIALDRNELASALAAEALRAPIEAAARAGAEASAAASVEVDAARFWEAAGEQATDAAALTALIDDLTGELTLLGAAAEQEAALGRAVEQADVANADLRTSRAALIELENRVAVLPVRRGELEAELSQLNGADVALAAARSAVTAVGAQLAAARDAATKAAEMTAAERAHAGRLADLEARTTAVSALLRRRLAGFAGELATSLVEGEPCMVCGSRAHPEPAEHDDEPVTAAMIADAEARKDAAARAEGDASSAAQAARAAYAEASARAGGATVAHLEAALATAHHDATVAEADAARRGELTALHAQLAELQEAAGQELRQLEQHVATAREAVAVAEERVRTLSETVGAARAGHPSIGARIDAVGERRALARTLADAMEHRREREAAARAAGDDRDAWVAASEFPDAATATEALREASRREALAARIRTHEVALASERDRLRDLELALAGQPEEVIDLEEAQAAVALARSAWRDAAAQAAHAADAAARLRSLADRMSLVHAETAELAAAHELITGLADAVSGRTSSRMDLETFVLAAELEEIVTRANLRLDEMSSGRYRLLHSDAVAVRGGASGLGLDVLDAYTGRARPPQSLSGGETFLASLALALGLAEVVTARAGGLRLDTLFIDEGFGSLDAETLDLAMRTLDELRQGGRTVGVISHVEAMKDQLPAQLRVVATAAGPSVIHQESTAPTARAAG